MKRIIIILSILSGLLASCDYENPIDKDLSSDMDEIMVTPSRLEIYLDTDIPLLSVMYIPSYAKDTTITWSSSHPGLVEIDPVSGKMKLLKNEPTQVYITATSRDGNHTASCELNIHMTTTPMEYYEPMDLRKDFGLWILDRSCGTLLGGIQHLQWGRNIPCKGGVGVSLWKADPAADEFLDWTDPSKTLAPKGWRLPTKAELEVIASQTNKTPEMSYDEQKRAEVMLERLKLASLDYWRYGGKVKADGTINPNPIAFDAWWGFDDCFWPSSDRVLPEDQEGEWPQVYVLHFNKLTGTAKVEKLSVRFALPVRFVKQ